MAGMGKFDCKGLKDLQKELDKLRKETNAFVEACAKELAARLLAKVIRRTPVGDYHGGEYQCKAQNGPKFTHCGWKVKGKVGGTLRRGWTAQKAGSGAEGLKSNSAKQYADSLKINHFGNVYVVEIINPVEYVLT